MVVMTDIVPTANLFLASGAVVTLGAACWDVVCRRIPDTITLTAMAVGLIGHTLFGGLDGLLWAVGGLAVGFGIFLIPVLLGGMGAGDLKLMAGLGTLLGPQAALEVALASTLVGGVIAVVAAVRRGVLRRALGRALTLRLPRLALDRTEIAAEQVSVGTIPFGVAIFAGTWLWILGNALT
jgi:prepilin peptidase CpaA